MRSGVPNFSYFSWTFPFFYIYQNIVFDLYGDLTFPFTHADVGYLSLGCNSKHGQVHLLEDLLLRLCEKVKEEEEADAEQAKSVSWLFLYCYNSASLPPPLPHL